MTVPKAIRNSHTVYNRTIPLQVLDAQFQCPVSLSVYLLFSTLLRRSTAFFGLGPNCAHFCGFWGNNSSKKTLDWAEHLTTGSSHSCTNTISSILENSNFYRDRGCKQRVSFWFNFDPNLPPEDCRNQK